MAQIILEQEARIEGFKTELHKSQDVQLSTVNKDLERQQNFLDKMRAEVRRALPLTCTPAPVGHCFTDRDNSHCRHEIDKLTASQRLDLNLEKG
jgi:hypothetical protein